MLTNARPWGLGACRRWRLALNKWLCDFVCSSLNLESLSVLLLCMLTNARPWDGRGWVQGAQQTAVCGSSWWCIRSESKWNRRWGWSRAWQLQSRGRGKSLACTRVYLLQPLGQPLAFVVALTPMCSQYVASYQTCDAPSESMAARVRAQTLIQTWTFTRFLLWE